MKDCILFLNGSYRSKELSHYLNLSRGKFTVAVDGGYAFFRRTRTFPDLLIGDFDSIRSFPRHLPESTKVLRYPSKKDKTDAELALEYCLEHGAKRIDIIQPSYGEPDQLLGNFLLLSLVASETQSVSKEVKRATKSVKPGSKKTGSLRSSHHLPKVRILNRRYEVVLLNNATQTISDGVGDTISVLPLSDEISLTTTGAEFNVRDVRISRGRSLGLRNRIARNRASITIQGTALIVRQFSSGVAAKR